MNTDALLGWSITQPKILPEVYESGIHICNVIDYALIRVSNAMQKSVKPNIWYTLNIVYNTLLDISYVV